MSRPFSVFGSSLFESTATPQLGPLERQMLRAVWSRGSATVRELLAEGNIHQAYTTVMTTMDRLYKKGFLDRAADGRAFRYTPHCTPEELQRDAAINGIGQLLALGGDLSLPLSCLVEAISAQDAQLLDELQLLIERKRRDLKADATAQPPKAKERR